MHLSGFTAAATVRPSRQTATSTATTSTTPASCSSPMLVRNSDTTSEEPALRAMEIAIQVCLNGMILIGGE